MKNKEIDNYIQKYPKNAVDVLEKIRQLIREVVPDAVEVMSYGIPTFDLAGKHLVHFGAFKNHISFFPTSSPIPVFKKELKNYKTSKGTIQFPLNEKIPYDLIRRIVIFRVKEVTSQKENLKKYSSNRI